VNQLDKAAKDLSVAIKSIAELPEIYDYDSASIKKGINRFELELYREQLNSWSEKLKSFDKNTLLFNRICIAFQNGYGIAEYDNILETNDMIEIIAIFIENPDLENVRKIWNRYKDKQGLK
jgi:hypothetical protein